MTIQATEYGPLSNLVATAGAVIAAGAAIAFAWRGRMNWEPSEDDIPKGPQKVGGLIAAVTIVVIWSQYFEVSHLPQVKDIAWVLLGITVLSLLAYILLVTTQTYTKIVSPEANRTEKRKIIGGFWLTTEAKRIKRQKKVTVQELLKGAAYDEDKVWSRLSRALSKICFVLCYLGLTVCGTVALASAAMIVDLANKR
jgi:Ca2+/H+ antiporter